MEYEFQLHPPPSLLPDGNPSYDPTMFWSVEATAYGKNRQLWGWETPCSICGDEAPTWSKEKGYRCWRCYSV